MVAVIRGDFAGDLRVTPRRWWALAHRAWRLLVLSARRQRCDVDRVVSVSARADGDLNLLGHVHRHDHMGSLGSRTRSVVSTSQAARTDHRSSTGTEYTADAA